MPRGSNGVYQLPAGSQAQPNTVIESAMYNATILDLQQDLNAVRPISSGGTGQASLAAVKLAFGITALENIVGTGEINADNITSGTVAPARLSGNYDISISGNAATANNAENSTNLNNQPASFYQNATNLNAGTLSTDRLSGTYNISITGNASSLGGLPASNFVRREEQNINFTGSTLSLQDETNFGSVRLSSGTVDNTGFVEFLNSTGVRKGFVGFGTDSGVINAHVENGATAFSFNTTPQVSGNQIWHAGNDGSNSGLDADLLDGQQGSFYQNAGNLNAGTIPAARLGSKYVD